MHIEPDGTFEVIISQREHPGNWLRSEADTRSSPSARRSSTSATSDHAEMHIERIDDDGTPPPPAHAAEHLHRGARSSPGTT